MDSVNLHFFHPQFFTGNDGYPVTTAGRTIVEVRPQGELGGTIAAPPPGWYPLYDQACSLQKGSLGTSLETKFHRFRDNTAQLSDLQNDRGNAPAAGAALADVYHTLGKR